MKTPLLFDQIDSKNKPILKKREASPYLSYQKFVKMKGIFHPGFSPFLRSFNLTNSVVNTLLKMRKASRSKRSSK